MLETSTKTGYITQIIGPVVDAVFPSGDLPKIYNAININFEGKVIVCEVQQLLGDNKVRAVSMSATDGLQRGLRLLILEHAISVPVGVPTLGRIFNILGDPVDNGIDIENDCERSPIHRDAPAFTELETKPSCIRNRY